MNKKPVVILHGYSDNSKSFEPLARFLKSHGFQVVDLWLADYLSMYDELTIEDLGQAMGTALDAHKIPRSPKSFDLIAHSTGGLVVRSYLAHYFYGHPEKCPIEHLVLLAPANFGSPLAALGKSMLGRLFKGWSWDHLFQTGTRILQALELASPISWELARKDLFDPKNPLFKVKNLYTTVLIGTEAYDGLRELAHENGSDGTVRVSTANLNARYLRLNFEGEDSMKLEEIPGQYDPIAFGVLYGFNHGTIVNPEKQTAEQSPLGELILESLAITSKSQYRDHLEKLKKITAETFQKGKMNKNSEHYHEYQNLSVRVYDQYKEMIPDYFLEFFEENNDPKDKVMRQIQSEILEKVRLYSGNGSYRSLLFDITDLREKILKPGHEIDMSIAVAAKSERISYRNPKEYLTLASPKNEKFIVPNGTLFLDICVERIQAPEVFKLKKFK